MFCITRPEGYSPFLRLSFPLSIQATLATIFGILATYAGYSLVTGLLVASGIVGFLIGYYYQKVSLKKICFWALFCLLGAFQTYRVLTNRSGLFPLYTVTLEGTVTEIAYTDAKPWRYHSLLSVSRIYTVKGWQKTPCVIQLYSHKAPRFSVDDTVHCSVDQIFSPSGDFVWYLSKEGIDATAFQEIISSTVIKHPSWSLRRFLAEKRKRFHQLLERKIKPQTFALFSSLFLGNRAAIKQDLEEQKPLFKVWGISHFLARSGVHLLLFVMILEFVLRLLPLSFFIKQSILILLTFLYTLFSWAGISFYRALFTFLFYKMATLQALPFHSMHALGFVCTCVLLYSPLQLFFLDFQLTFLLTFCLIWIAHTHHQRRLLYTQMIASRK